MKRRPLLVDEVLASRLNPLIDKRRQLAHRDRLREAKKFVLDAQAVRWAARMMVTHPTAIARDQQFAIPPFPNMYIEIATWREFYDTVQPDVPWDEENGDDAVGFHIDGPRAYVLTGARAARAFAVPTSAVMPFVYRLNKPFTIEEEQRYAEMLSTSRMGLDEFYWGTVWNILTEQADRRALRANHSFEWWYDRAVPDPKLIAGVTRGSAGDLRNIVALPLFLNRTSDLRYEEEMGVVRAMVHARPSALVRHSIVRLRLDPAPRLRELYEPRAGTGPVWRREHDVRGHFCHDKDARAGCAPDKHGWHEYGVNQWRCMKCAGLRWWRKACRRGTRKSGQVKTQYAVTAGRTPHHPQPQEQRA